MFTNTVFKKLSVVSMMLAMCCMLFLTIGCSEDQDNPVANNQDKIVTITTPDGEEYQISQAEIDKFAAQSRAYEDMIKAMDPYVTENKDGTYHFNADAFMATNPKMDELGNKVYSELTKGIPVVNKMLLSERKQAGSTALSLTCSYRWYGKKCCYTGNTAWQVAGLYTAMGFIPYIGFIPGFVGIYLGYYAQIYGGYCVHQSWVGGYWVTSS